MEQTPARQEASKFATRHLRWNMVTLVANMAFFALALTFASNLTILPALAERLGASNTVIGLIPAIMMLGWTMPAIFTANFSDRLSRKLPTMLRYTWLERLPLLLLAIAVYLLAEGRPALVLVIMLIALAVLTTAGGALAPVWIGMISKVIPVTLRGRFYASGAAIGAGMGLGASVFVGYALESYRYPSNYAIILSAGFVAAMIGYLLLALAREPEVIIDRPKLSLRAYFAHLPVVLRGNHNFSWYLLARAVSVLGMMSNGLFTVYALRELQLPEWQVGAFNFALMASQIVFNLTFGPLADRKGHKIVIVLGSIALVGANVAALMASQEWWLIYLVYIGIGAAFASIQVSAPNILLEFAPPAEQATYFAVGSVAVSPAIFIAPVIGGIIADEAGYQAMFWVAIIAASLGTSLLTFHVRDPRRAPA